MGNRANVIFTNGEMRFSPAIYLHWNGGPESVYAFLKELDRRKVRADQEYEASRFAQIVCEFFDGRERFETLSVGIVNVPLGVMDKHNLEVSLQLVRTDPGDNGFYVVNRTERDVQGLPKVRRFTSRYDPGGTGRAFRELNEAEVEYERKLAITNSAYAEPIEEFFRSLDDPRNQIKDRPITN